MNSDADSTPAIVVSRYPLAARLAGVLFLGIGLIFFTAACGRGSPAGDVVHMVLFCAAVALPLVIAAALMGARSTVTVFPQTRTMKTSRGWLAWTVIRQTSVGDWRYVLVEKKVTPTYDENSSMRRDIISYPVSVVGTDGACVLTETNRSSPALLLAERIGRAAGVPYHDGTTGTVHDVRRSPA